MSYKTEIRINEYGVSTATNKSVIEVLVLVYEGAGTISGGAVSITLPDNTTQSLGTLNGTKLDADTVVTAFATALDVIHKADGSGSITVNVGAWTATGISQAAMSESYTLTPITHPNALVISDTWEVGVNRSIYITTSYSSVKSTIVVEYEGTRSTILNNSSSASLTYAFPATLFNQGTNPQTLSIPATFTIYSTLNGEPIGSNTYQVKVLAPVNAPVITGTTGMPYPDDWYLFAYEALGSDVVQAETATHKYFNNGMTKLSLGFDCTPQQGTYIATIRFTGDFGDYLLHDADINGTVSINTTLRYLVGKNGTNTGTLVVTDSRGNTSTRSLTQIFNTPIPPTLSNISLQRGSYSGGIWTDDSENGTAIKLQATQKTDPGSAVVTYYVNGTQQASETRADSSNPLIHYFTGISTSANTLLAITLNDYLAESEYTLTAAMSKPDLNYNPSTHGFAFGKESSKTKTVEVGNGWSFEPDCDITFSGLKGQTTYRSVRFSCPDNSTYPHSVRLFGGNPTSNRAIGVYDENASKLVWYYDDQVDDLFFKNNEIAFSSVLKRNNNYISSTADINDCQEPGYYIQPNIQYASTSRNYPKAIAGILEVLGNENSHFIIQRYTASDCSNAWVRRYWYSGGSGTWSAWKQIW